MCQAERRTHLRSNRGLSDAFPILFLAAEHLRLVFREESVYGLIVNFAKGVKVDLVLVVAISTVVAIGDNSHPLNLQNRKWGATLAVGKTADQTFAPPAVLFAADITPDLLVDVANSGKKFPGSGSHVHIAKHRTRTLALGIEIALLEVGS